MHLFPTNFSAVFLCIEVEQTILEKLVPKPFVSKDLARNP